MARWRRPGRLFVLRAGARAFADVLPCTLAVPCLGRIELALLVDGEVVDSTELARLVPVPAEMADDAAVVAYERPHMVVLAVGVVQPGLGYVVGDVDIPCRSAAARRARDDEFLHEGSVLLEDLDAVVRPVAHVQE